MTTPGLVRPEVWLRTFPMTGHGIMSCHWSDVERGHVVPKYPGQQFHFVDLDEVWMYTGDPEDDPLPETRPNWAARIILVFGLILFGIEGYLIHLLLQKLGWFQ